MVTEAKKGGDAPRGIGPWPQTSASRPILQGARRKRREHRGMTVELAAEWKMPGWSIFHIGSRYVYSGSTLTKKRMPRSIKDRQAPSHYLLLRAGTTSNRG